MSDPATPRPKQPGPGYVWDDEWQDWLPPLDKADVLGLIQQVDGKGQPASERDATSKPSAVPKVTPRLPAPALPESTPATPTDGWIGLQATPDVHKDIADSLSLPVTRPIAAPQMPQDRPQRQDPPLPPIAAPDAAEATQASASVFSPTQSMRMEDETIPASGPRQQPPPSVKVIPPAPVQAQGPVPTQAPDAIKTEQPEQSTRQADDIAPLAPFQSPQPSPQSAPPIASVQSPQQALPTQQTAGDSGDVLNRILTLLEQRIPASLPQSIARWDETRAQLDSYLLQAQDTGNTVNLG